MIQLELYIREITRFLRTVTLKNNYFKDQMEETYASDAFKGKYPDDLHPYYRRLLGKPTYESLSEFRALAGIPDSVTDGQIAVEYGFDYVKVPDVRPESERDQEVTYTTVNGLDIKLTSYPVNIKNEENKLEPYKVYPNCILYYGQICPVRALYKKFDELMVINSIDTKKIVPFNSYILKSREHQKTASLYRMPSRYYSKICSKYPRNTDLIKAIVYPVSSIEDCVNASNYSLISCDLTQLRENERASMYNCLLDTLSMIKVRWDVSEFVYEDLYALSIQAKIWDILLLALMQQRIKNIRTSAAHEYHIWEYLKSHGLDDYSDVLSLKQSLFLYRNFPYLLRNRGSDFNLVLLAHKLLSDWNISLYGKNILQTTDDLQETCKTSPYVDSVVVGKTVLSELSRIDRSDVKYLNKTAKAKDELESFDYRLSDIQQNQAGKLETLDFTYEKEQNVGLEYQNDSLFERSTSVQTKQFTDTPHTSFVTKLLEISKENVSTLFKQIYARFMTESLLYRASIDQADYYISFVPDGMNYSVDISVKNAIGLVWFCALKELGIYSGDAYQYPYMYLTVPYKESFEPIQNSFYWRNNEYNTTDILRVLPITFEIESDDLPSECCGTFTIVDKDVPSDEWKWSNNSGVTIYFEVDESNRRWRMATSSYNFIADFRTPYDGWRHQEMDWKLDDEEYTSFIKLSTYEYLMDALMPNGEPKSFKELMNLLHEQALGYIQIYKELHGSDWSRQHTGVTDILKERTVNKVIKLNLFESDDKTTVYTFEQFIEQNADIKELVTKIEGNTTLVARTEYAKLGNSIVKALFPIDTDYLEDNSGVSANRFTRLKELFVSLCSYNIAYLEGTVNSVESSLILSSFITQDYDYGESGFKSNYFINTASLSVDYEHVLDYKIGPINIICSFLPDYTTTPFGLGDTYCTHGIEYAQMEANGIIHQHLIVRDDSEDEWTTLDTLRTSGEHKIVSCFHEIVDVNPTRSGLELVDDVYTLYRTTDTDELEPVRLVLKNKNFKRRYDAEGNIVPNYK